MERNLAQMKLGRNWLTCRLIVQHGLQLGFDGMRTDSIINGEACSDDPRWVAKDLINGKWPLGFFFRRWRRWRISGT
ncbi:hypothetical protein Csa_017604 [Cucumis sativus]|uniref:Uncharacterized protein n=1 Tax=Cucumis sativus TaxID=3659 RepID=A0A0A0LBR4_CUCSA|nr:hypothetical protein Csa_017604 [Cucumis sativus]